MQLLIALQNTVTRKTKNCSSNCCGSVILKRKKMAGNSPIRKSFQVVRIIEAMPNQPQWHHSGRVCLPSQFLASILVNSGSDIPPLMAFDVAKDGFHIKCGVVEFTAKRGQIWMPDWMMERLRIGSQPDDGQETRVTVTFLPILPKGK